jgi:hypothetical protein
MSIRIMSAVWALDTLGQGETLVMLALADWANDDGHCYPSMAKLSRKCRMTERGTRAIIAGLCKAGHLTRQEVVGKGVNYFVHPGTTIRGEQVSGGNKVPQTPEARSANTSGTVIAQKATLPEGRARKPKFVLPEGIDPDDWAGFEEMRRRIGKPMTDHAKGLALKRLTKLADDGWPPGDVLNNSTLNSYQGLFPPKDDNSGSSRQSNPQQSGIGRNRAAAAPLRAILAGRRSDSAFGTG